MTIIAYDIDDSEEREIHDRAVELYVLSMQHYPVGRIFTRLHDPRPPFLCIAWGKTDVSKRFIEKITSNGMILSRTGPSGESYCVGDPKKGELYKNILAETKLEEAKCQSTSL